MNGYGFELLSDRKIDVENWWPQTSFKPKTWWTTSMQTSMLWKWQGENFAILPWYPAYLSGLPRQTKKKGTCNHPAQLLFNVFTSTESDNLLYLQTYEEVRTFQLEEARMRRALERILSQTMVIKILERPSPFPFHCWWTACAKNSPLSDSKTASNGWPWSWKTVSSIPV